MVTCSLSICPSPAQVLSKPINVQVVCHDSSLHRACLSTYIPTGLSWCCKVRPALQGDSNSSVFAPPGLTCPQAYLVSSHHLLPMEWCSLPCIFHTLTLHTSQLMVLWHTAPLIICRHGRHTLAGYLCPMAT